MDIKQITVSNTQEFCDLIVDMYSHLENLEWFTPMPYDYDNVKSMIENPRFYIIGAFEDDKLVGVSSLDYKCGKLIGKFDFPSECTLENTVELAFNMVHSKHRGKGIMKLMIASLLEKVTADKFEWVFSKAHKDNLASSKSLIKNGLVIYKEYIKPVNKNEFIELSSKDFFSKSGKENAKKTLAKYKETDENIIVEYYVLLKKLK